MFKYLPFELRHLIVLECVRVDNVKLIGVMLKLCQETQDITKMLLKKCTDDDVFIQSCKKGMLNVLKIIVKYHNYEHDIIWHGFAQTKKERHFHIIKYLIKNKIFIPEDVDAYYMLQFRDIEIIKCFCKLIKFKIEYVLEAIKWHCFVATCETTTTYKNANWLKTRYHLDLCKYTKTHRDNILAWHEEEKLNGHKTTVKWIETNLL